MKVHAKRALESDVVAGCFREMRLFAVLLFMVIIGTAPAARAQTQGARETAPSHVGAAKPALISPALCGQMHNAAKKGDLEKVKALLNDNPALISCSSNDLERIKPIHSAVLGGHIEVVQYLLAKKANVNERTIREDINNCE